MLIYYCYAPSELTGYTGKSFYRTEVCPRAEALPDHKVAVCQILTSQIIENIISFAI